MVLFHLPLPIKAERIIAFFLKNRPYIFTFGVSLLRWRYPEMFNSLELYKSESVWHLRRPSSPLILTLHSEVSGSFFCSLSTIELQFTAHSVPFSLNMNLVFTFITFYVLLFLQQVIFFLFFSPFFTLEGLHSQSF